MDATTRTVGRRWTGVIIETHCNWCDKHIGYISMTDLPIENSKFVKMIQCKDVLIELICDSCRKGMIDEEGE